MDYSLTGESVLLSWNAALRVLYAQCGSLSPLIHGTTAELLGASNVVLQPRNNLIASSARAFNYRYMVAESIWNLLPTADTTVLQKVFPGVLRFTADQRYNKTTDASWAYGESMYWGLRRVVQELNHDRTSRRAVINVPTLDNANYEDWGGTPPCLHSVQYLIRREQLNCIVTMRSNDVWRGMPLDMYQFTFWQIMLAEHLGVEVGWYQHNVGSLHLYETDVPAVTAYLAAEQNVETRAVVAPCALKGPAALAQVLSEDGYLRTAYEDGHTFSDDPTNLDPYINFIHNPLADDFIPKEFRALRDLGYGSGW